MWRLTLLSGAIWAQFSSPNSFAALSVAAVAPSGSTMAKGLTYPTSGHALTGAGIGFQVHAFIASYVSLNLRFSQSFFPLDARSLGRDGALFPDRVRISQNPTISHTQGGLGVGTGLKLDWVSFYVPLQLAFGIYSAPEIEGERDAARAWISPKFSTFQLGLSTGLITNFTISNNFFLGVSLLFTSLRSGEKEFERNRYTFGVMDRQFIYRSTVPTDLVELGALVGITF
ncbi:MAG: hypothetical protein N3E49_03540 [Bacteroidia bacterium]|nr:hypothetical protein [Bacteroidia bacterium]